MGLEMEGEGISHATVSILHTKLYPLGGTPTLTKHTSFDSKISSVRKIERDRDLKERNERLTCYHSHQSFHYSSDFLVCAFFTIDLEGMLGMLCCADTMFTIPFPIPSPFPLHPPCERSDVPCTTHRSRVTFGFVFLSQASSTPPSSEESPVGYISVSSWTPPLFSRSLRTPNEARYHIVSNIRLAKRGPGRDKPPRAVLPTMIDRLLGASMFENSYIYVYIYTDIRIRYPADRISSMMRSHD